MSLKHLTLLGHHQNRKYRSKATSRASEIPSRDARVHGGFLLEALNNSFDLADNLKKKSRLKPLSGSLEGIYLEIYGNKEDGLKFDSLDNKSIFLNNVRIVEDKIIATVFIPDDKRKNFLSKFNKYIETADKVKPQNLPLINTILNIKIANIESFWTDKQHDFPKEKNKKYWWEVWLSKPKNKENFEKEIKEFCSSTGVKYTGQSINLKRTVIILVEATVTDLEKSLFMISNLEELRFVDETPRFFLDQKPKDNKDWVDDLLQRLELGPDCENTKISILDTGINYQHPLLSPFIKQKDCYSYGSHGQKWPLYSPHIGQHHHGSLQAGVALYGDLLKALHSNQKIYINYGLESGRILPERGQNNPLMYGYITQNLCYQMEIKEPEVKRIFSMAVTAQNTTGHPSSWSSALDNLASQDFKRLIVVSAGNSNNINLGNNNWDNITLNPIQDPAQAWNVITVGAYTDLYGVQDPNYHNWTLISEPGELTVTSTSSVAWTWGKNAPIKPEVVFEGGNYLLSPCGQLMDSCDDISILTTSGGNYNYFDLHRDTSAATAKASKYLAEIVSAYSEYWPETHRAILVQSAEWTPAMKQYVLDSGGRTLDKWQMLKMAGYGVPNLEKALNSYKNNVLLVIEKEIEPFALQNDGNIVFNEMHVHDIPMPEILYYLVKDKPQTNAKLKVTLSYFVEPNPSTKILSNKYYYRSVGFTFKVKSPYQTEQNFLAVVNQLDIYDDYTGPDTSNEGWYLTNDLRRLGSIHSDTWEGSVADLVNMNKIAIMPITGWWKNVKSEIDNFKTRYSLIVSLDIQEDIDIYSEIQNLIVNENKVVNEVQV